jgi:two-component system response regulator FixJ
VTVNATATTTATVYVVDDDPAIRRALPRLLRSAGINTVAFDSLASLLEADLKTEDACVVADIRLKGEDGLALPRLLAERNLKLPVVFLTAVDSTDIRERAIHAGGAAFFRKPVDDLALIDSIRWVLAAGGGRRTR